MILKRKNKLIIFLILALFFGNIFLVAQAETLTLNSSSSSIKKDNTFTLTLNISSVSNLFGIAFDLDYDSSLLSLTSAQEGNFLSNGCNTSFMTSGSTPGKIIVGFTRLGTACGGVSGTGDLVSFNFKALKAGTNNFTFSNNSLCLLSGSECNNMTGAWSSKSITIEESTSTTPETPTPPTNPVNPTPTPTPPNDTTDTDKTPPGEPTNFKSSINSQEIYLKWNNPVDTDFNGVILIKSEQAISTSTTASLAKQNNLIIYDGISNTFSDTNTNNKTYYYALIAYDKNFNYSKTVLVNSSPEELKTTIPPTTPSNKTDNTATNSQTNLTIKQESGTIFEYNKFIPLNDVNKKLYNSLSGKNSLSTQAKCALAFFIQQGTDSTKKLGSGERANVLNSYKTAFNKLPSSENDWSDVVKIANGKWPVQGSALAEKNASDRFKKIYKRNPNNSNANDVSALKIMAYGLRPTKRNLDSEKAAIKSFKAIYSYNPKSTNDWDAVRAIAYSGSKR